MQYSFSQCSLVSVAGYKTTLLGTMEEKQDGGGVSALCLVATSNMRSRPLERVIAATIIPRKNCRLVHGSLYATCTRLTHIRNGNSESSYAVEQAVSFLFVVGPPRNASTA